jgi:hypothetical protein
MCDGLLRIAHRFMNVIDDSALGSYNIKPPHPPLNAAAGAKIDQVARFETINHILRGSGRSDFAPPAMKEENPLLFNRR